MRAAAIQGGVLLSVRGGDYELTVGQDLSIGYADHDRHTVELYLTESFTFRVLEPRAWPRALSASRVERVTRREQACSVARELPRRCRGGLYSTAPRPSGTGGPARRVRTW